jgi:hypothetical protein
VCVPNYIVIHSVVSETKRDDGYDPSMRSFYARRDE